MNGASLKTRLLVWLLPALILLVIVAAVGLYSLQKDLLVQQFDQQLGKRAFDASRDLWIRRVETVEADASEPLEGLQFVEMWDLDTGRLWRALPDDHRPSAAPLVPAPADRDAVLSTVRLDDGRRVRVLALRMRPPRRPWRGRPDHRRPETEPTPFALDDPDGPASGDGTPPEEDRELDTRNDRLFLAAADLAPLHAELRRWATWLSFASAASIGIVAVIVLLGVNRGLRPLHSVAADIATVDAAHLTQRVHGADVPAELRPVVAQLNGLLDRLQQAFERERSFLAAAAHELRTPLAGVRSQLEVCLRRPRTPEDYRGTMQGCLQSTISIQRIVDALLQISRLEAGQVPTGAEAVDLSRMLAEEIGSLGDTMGQRNLSLRWDVREHLRVTADPELLRRVVANLLNNAAVYADAGTWVAVTARPADDMVQVEITNPAADLQRCDLDRMFDPFWRRDEARSDGGAHAGIGLAIVRQAVTVLGGRIAADLDTAGTLALTLRLAGGDGGQPRRADGPAPAVRR
ncbi:MAG: hypothetical protein GX591_08010 [Planctomycetes bacterium]|nr:hypothetical protein [Planctomycetota bacterium]